MPIGPLAGRGRGPRSGRVRGSTGPEVTGKIADPKTPAAEGAAGL